MTWARQVRTARDDLDPVSAAALTLVYERGATPAQAAALLGLELPRLHAALAAGLRGLAALVCPPP